MRKWVSLLRPSPQGKIIGDQLNVDDTAKLHNILEKVFIQPLHRVDVTYNFLSYPIKHELNNYQVRLKKFFYAAEQYSRSIISMPSSFLESHPVLHLKINFILSLFLCI